MKRAIIDLETGELLMELKETDRVLGKKDNKKLEQITPEEFKNFSVQDVNNIYRALKSSREINKYGFITSNFNLCFGGQCYIKLNFLEKLEHKYGITNLVHSIHNRTDRCSLERILGLLFCQEYPNLMRIQSLFGDIMKQPHAFSYDYNDYKNDLSNKRILSPFVKVWTGR